MKKNFKVAIAHKYSQDKVSTDTTLKYIKKLLKVWELV
jgi:hypothetical protein